MAKRLDFDIAISEAAAAGLVPVVYRDGGGWTDIVSRIDQGLGYISAEEALISLGLCLTTLGGSRPCQRGQGEVAKGFGYENFKARLSEVIKELAGSKAKS